MTKLTNRRFTLAARPQGAAKLSDFKLVETDVPSIKNGEVLFAIRYSPSIPTSAT